MNKLKAVATGLFNKVSNAGKSTGEKTVDMLKKILITKIKLSIFGPAIITLTLAFIIFLVIVSMFTEKMGLLQMVDSGGASGGTSSSLNVNFNGGKGSLTAEQRQKIVEFAISQIGVPYNYGSGGACGGGAWSNDIPNKQLSCNGLTRWSYDAAGISIPVGSTDQMVNAPVVTSTGKVSDMTPGDIIVYDREGNRTIPGVNYNNTGLHHVALYIGNGELVEGTCPVAARRAVTDDSYSYSVTW